MLKYKKIPKDFDIDKLLKNENEYINIDLGDVNNLVGEMKKNV